MYNCENQIARVIKKISENSFLFYEILAIDNRSQDETINRCAEAMQEIKNAKCTIIKNTENFNLGGSHKTAFLYALENKLDYLVVTHGDDQGDINNLIPLIKEDVHKKYDCLLGARFHKESKLVNYSMVRIIANKVFNILYSLVARKRLQDLGSGLNLYDVNFLKSKFFLTFPNNLLFNYYVLLYSCDVDCNFIYFPLTWVEEDQVSNANLMNIGFTALRIIFSYTFNRKKFLNMPIDTNYNYSYEVMYSGPAKD